MRIFAISDLHLDYQQNVNWLLDLSVSDYTDDVLILAGDISDNLELLEHCFEQLMRRFRHVAFVPGNHDLWTIRDKVYRTSFDKFNRICQLAIDYGVSTKPVHLPGVSIVPLFSWYDFTFGEPSEQLLQVWMDFRACEWGRDVTSPDITQFFLDKNLPNLQTSHQSIISFSHFLPRIDVMPSFIPLSSRYIYPVLGSDLIDAQVRQLSSKIHVYGHSHVNRDCMISGIRYINNAFGYPGEDHISLKRLVRIYES